MKKLYKAPVMIIVKMKPHAIMQASNGTLDSGRSITSSSEFGSRRSSFWDDEEDE